ncbi:MAG: formate dehydrogenase accessory protein FdhE [Anaerolineae bacterium]|nr:formate dehydrogenase accessory protein FdhE [Anaerolineae bacterium]
MAMSEHDRKVLQALNQAGEQHPEMADLFDFYLDLYRMQYQAKEDLPDPEVRDEMAASWRLEGGIPQLTFDQLAVEPVAFARLVDEVRTILRRHNPGWEVEEGEENAKEVVRLAKEIFETWETLTSPGSGTGAAGDRAGAHTSPTSLVVGFALAPYLLKAADAILPHLDLERWVHGYCPVCGGRPNLSLLEAKRGARRLICSRCNSQWGYSRVGCPFCKSKEKQTYYAGTDGVHRLYVCPDCNRYLKTVDLRELSREVVPEVERLLTVGMDLAAQQQGIGS